MRRIRSLAENVKMATLSREQQNLLPTEIEVEQYEKNGWYVTPHVVPHEILDRAMAGMHALYRGERDIDTPKMDGPANDVFSADKTFMNNEFASLQRSEIRELVTYPLIAAIAARLARSHEIRLFADALMCKFPEQSKRTGALGWHADKAYWPTSTSRHMLTAWIPLQDTTVEMGTLQVIEGSHSWPREESLMQYCSFGTQKLGEFNDWLAQNKPDHKRVSMTLKKGQLSFHHCDAFHCSAPNQSETPRAVVAIHMQDHRNEFQKKFNKDGSQILIGYDRTAQKTDNGDPDYHDPVFFPVLWRDVDARSK